MKKLKRFSLCTDTPLRSEKIGKNFCKGRGTSVHISMLKRIFNRLGVVSFQIGLVLL